MSALKLRYLRSMNEVPESAWDSLEPRHVFSSHAWLSALEGSGLVSEGKALEYRIPVFEDAAGAVVAAAPAVIKRQALGEYGPENIWISRAARSGTPLLPKLQLETPFMPAPSPRILVHPSLARDAVAGVLVRAILETSLGQALPAVTMARMSPADEQAARFHGAVVSGEVGTQWRNEGYASHEEFVARLRWQYRYGIKRERKDFRALGLEVKELRGREITAAHWDAFFAGYQAICRSKRSPLLLNREFLDRLSVLGDAVWLIALFSGGEFLSGAYLVRSGDTLYSRNWSELRYTPGAAFELGIYRPIQAAIESGLAVVDCGVWGPHKPKRGVEPVIHANAHWFRDTSARQQAEQVVARHREVIASQLGAPWKEHYMRTAPAGAS